MTVHLSNSLLAAGRGLQAAGCRLLAAGCSMNESIALGTQLTSLHSSSSIASINESIKRVIDALTLASQLTYSQPDARYPADPPLLTAAESINLPQYQGGGGYPRSAIPVRIRSRTALRGSSGASTRFASAWFSITYPETLCASNLFSITCILRASVSTVDSTLAKEGGYLLAARPQNSITAPGPARPQATASARPTNARRRSTRALQPRQLPPQKSAPCQNAQYARQGNR